jgi:hypothetical protein
MRSLVKILVLASALLGLTSTALADVSPSIEVRLVSPFVAVSAGDTYEGRLEITSKEIGTLSEFTLASDGWNASMNNSPSTRAVQVGDVLTIDFTASATDPTKLIEFGCDFNGYPVRYAVDLSEENVRNMTEGAAVQVVSEFQAIPGDRSYGQMDVLLGGDLTKAADDARYTINVSGRFGCTRNDGSWLPAHSITIEVWDQDASGGDDLMGTGSTNFDGYYSIDVESTDGDGTGSPDIYVKFILVNNRARCYEPTSGNNYAYVTGVTTNYGGTSLDFGSLQPANPDLQPSVFMHTNATRAWVHDYNLGYDIPACRVEWPSAAWPNCSPDGRLQMRVDFSWRDGTIFHEYGHWFDHEMASWGTWDYCNGVCDNSPTDCGHCFWCQESQAIAWLEGWAQFHGIAISDWYPGFYGMTPLSPVTGENLSTCGGGYDVPLLTEGFIAALTNDIADNNQDSHGVYGAYTDRLATGPATVFAVNALDDPSGSQDFANKFVARYPGYRELFWETAANCGFWFDTTPPGVVTALNSPSHTAGVASPDPTVFMTWNRASDNYSGIAGYGLFIASGAPGLPSAVMDIGDVTSYTTAALSPGTYYFCIRAVDNAGYWSGSYANWGPIAIREPDPADLAPYLAGGWDYPLVPRTTNDSTQGSAVVPATLPGDATGTYWNIFGQNLGEAATGSGFWAWLNIDGVNEQNVFWNEINAGGLYYGPNRGPVYVQAGRHSFTSRHDATDLVAETNELNNVFGRQFIWTPHVVDSGVVASRPSPPPSSGGWDEVTSGVTYYNCDGLQMPTSGGWWHAMAVWADSDANDFDCRLHAVSTGAEDGFGTSLAYSASGFGYLDAVVVNRNQDSSTAWDVGVPVWAGEGLYKAHHAQSAILAFGDSVTVAMGTDVPVLLREFYLDPVAIGPISVTASGDPLDGPLELVVFNPDFTYGTTTAGSQMGSATSDISGLARVSADVPFGGWYGIMVYRNQLNGLAARDVTIEISTTPPDLVAWTPTGWHSGMVPRPALDGTNVWCPAPVILNSAPNPTYYNVAAQNLGPVPSILPTRVFRDGIYGGYINWGEVSSGGTVSYNWNYEHILSPGRHALGLRVDALQEIEETNEYNNTVGEQWIWDPDVMTPGDTDLRQVPPPTTGGWEDITNGDLLWYNCDGLRLVSSTTSQFWRALAILPEPGSDYDLRLHEPSTGAKSGFDWSLMGSYEAGTRTEYLLVDFNMTAFADYDVGVLFWSGTGSYRAHAGDSPYLGAPIGDWGPLAVPVNGLVDMVEFYFEPASYNVLVENLSGADLGLSVHQSGVGAFQNRLNAVAGATAGGPGEDESLTFSVPDFQYYCLVVYREDQGTDEAPYLLHIASSVSPVGDDDLPKVTQMAGAYPNPFNPQTTVAFELARDDHARVLIYDLQGRLIRRLVDQALPVGRHTAIWEGRDDSGRAVASGIYFARLEAASGGGMTKLVLVK